MQDSTNESDIPNNIREILSEEIDGAGITNKNPIPQLMDKIASNPDKMADIVKKIVPHVDGNLMAKAKKMANSGEAQRLMKLAQRKGTDINKMLSRQGKDNAQKILNKTKGVQNLPSRQCLVVTYTKKVLEEKIPVSDIMGKITKLVKSDDKTNLIKTTHPFLRRGPWKDLEIICYSCNANGSAKNILMSNLTGNDYYGDVVIICTSKDLKKQEFDDLAKLETPEEMLENII